MGHSKSDKPRFDEEASGESRPILSTTRLSVILSAFLIMLLALVGGFSYKLVARIFDQLTPAIAHDLEWKAERGTAELGRTLEFAVALGEEPKIREALLPYLTDPDISGIVVRDAEHKDLFVHPKGSGARLAKRFKGAPFVLAQDDESYSSWAKIEIEGGAVGELALEVSTERLRAGNQLRENIVTTMVGGSVLALILALIFVTFYIRPLIQVTVRAFADLEERTREALESARLKSEFLANMSHEIRTPMNGVIGMAELLQKTDLTKKQRRYARTITTSATALLTIINDILDFSKIEAGKLSVRPVETDVRHLAEEVAQLMAPQAQSKGLELLCAIAPEVPREVLVDHDRLRQVLTNIVGNAVKFTNSGNVVVRVGVAEMTSDGVSAILRFTIQDTGIGIAKEDHERIFELFSQVDGSLTRTRGGTGLGLAISKHLVELMGGHVSLESEIGKGSNFSFTITAEVLSGIGSRPSERNLPRTLIIDDNETNRTVLEELLDAWGVVSESARSADEALQVIEKSAKMGVHFGLALVDHEMHDMSGPELARVIREKQGERSPRLVLLTSLSNSGQLDDVFDDGLSKPFLQDDLKRVLIGSSTPGSGGSDTEIFVGDLKFTGRPRILVAEDNPINREVMREILEELEIDCDMAENGKEAIEHLDEKSYPLILMDCQMPELDGYEATRRIRKSGKDYANVPIVAVTAHAVVGEREKALAAGMTDYVTKPVTIIRLMRALARYLATESPKRSSPPETSVAQAEQAPPLPAVEEEGRSSINEEPGPPSTRHVLDPGVKRSKVVVNLFLKTVPDQLNAVRDAVERADANLIKQSAHKLKGGCLAIGARTMGSVCAQIEPNPPEALSLVDSLFAEYSMVKEALEFEIGA